MPKYLFQSRHNPEGVRGLLKEGGTSRRAATKEVIENAGGRLEAFYYAFGSNDVVIIADLPDNAAAASIALATGASGALNAETVVLLTPEEIDEATKKGVVYRPPGA